MRVASPLARARTRPAGWISISVVSESRFASEIVDVDDEGWPTRKLSIAREHHHPSTTTRSSARDDPAPSDASTSEAIIDRVRVRVRGGDVRGDGAVATGRVGERRARGAGAVRYRYRGDDGGDAIRR